MRSRTLREGSIGLFILMGVALFGLLILWLRGVRFSRDSYTVYIELSDSNGMIVGGAVRYRGVKVGTIEQLTPTTNGIEARVLISPADLLMSKNAQVEANQSGLISETTIDITPLSQVPNPDQLPSPLSRRCNREIVICNGDRLQGVTGISFNAAIRSTIRLSERLTDPEFFDNITSLTSNASLAAAQVAELGAELTKLSQSVRGELGVVSSTATSFSTTAQDLSIAARDITTIAATSARQINSTVAAYEGTAEELNALAGNVNRLINENQASIGTTLNSISSTSNELTVLIRNFNTTLESADTRELLDNLELLTANAAEASNALKTAADAFNDPTTILTLQRTMNAARATFENTQKITADLDELTGNPSFRRDVERLIRGLSGLVSSTQELEQQIGIAQQLELEADALANAAVEVPQGDQPILRSPSPEARRRAAIQVFTEP